MTELSSIGVKEVNLTINEEDIESSKKENEIETTEQIEKEQKEFSSLSASSSTNDWISFCLLVWDEIITTDDMPNLVEYLCPFNPDEEIQKPSVYCWMFIIITLRGISQVYLCAHPIAAIIICIGKLFFLLLWLFLLVFCCF